LPTIPTKELRQATDNLLRFFKIEGEPLIDKITEGRKIIFYSLVFQLYPRIQIICSTQYGKSLMVAFASLILTCILGKKVAVVAPSNNKARIIMRYYVDHLGDNIVFWSQLEKNTKLERLRQEESKMRIILKMVGVFILFQRKKKIQKKPKSIENTISNINMKLVEYKTIESTLRETFLNNSKRIWMRFILNSVMIVWIYLRLKKR